MGNAGSLPERKPRVAFVVQRYGAEVNGGAEALCRLVAERMARHWEVEVLTTCALDYVTWNDHYAAGKESLNGVIVHRFPVTEPRDMERFNRLSGEIRANPSPGREEHDAWMRAQGPWSPGLLEYITATRRDYDIFFFFGYLYAQTYFGLPLVSDRAVLAPFAHDEWTIHLACWDAVFRSPARLVFSTPEEKSFLERRFPTIPLSGPTVGVAVDRPARLLPRRFRSGHGIDGDFVLYVGRVDPSKGCQQMFDDFIAHVARTGDPRMLVTIGRAVMEIPKHPQIVPLGFVSEEAKWDALAACDVLLMPSPYESLSIALLEAWSVGKPVLVNGDCEVLKGQVERSGGGMAYESPEEFSAFLEVLSMGGAPGVLGRQGYEFVRSTYSWEAVEGAYLQIAHDVATSSRTRHPPIIDSHLCG